MRRLFRLGDRSPTLLLPVLGAFVALTVVWGLYHWFRLRAQNAEARAAALAACVDGGAEQADCSARVARWADDCGVLARHPHGRAEGYRTSFLQSEFDECIQKGPEAMLEARREQREREARERRSQEP